MSLNTIPKFWDKKECWFCGSTRNLHLHHIYFAANRKISDKNGFTAYLCMEHHTGSNGVHMNIENNLKLKRACEQWYLNNGHTKAEFMQLIGHNYIFEQ